MTIPFEKAFKALSVKKFKLICIVILLSGDLLSAMYTQYLLKKTSLIDEVVKQALLRKDLSINDLSIVTLENLKSIAISSIKLMITMFIIFHLINYTLFYFQKKISIHYVTFLSWVGSAIFLLTGSLRIFSGQFSEAFFLVLGLSYLFVAMGLRHFLKELLPPKA